MAKVADMISIIQFASNSLYNDRQNNAKYDINSENGEIEIIINEVERFILFPHELSQVPYKLYCRYKPILCVYPDSNDVNNISSLINFPTTLDRLIIYDAPQLIDLNGGEDINCCDLTLRKCSNLQNFNGCPTITESIEINNCNITSVDGLEDNFQGNEILFYNEIWEKKYNIGKKVFYSFEEFKEWFNKTYRRIS